jgi:hypothetical protein
MTNLKKNFAKLLQFAVKIAIAQIWLHRKRIFLDVLIARKIYFKQPSKVKTIFINHSFAPQISIFSPATWFIQFNIRFDCYLVA